MDMVDERNENRLTMSVHRCYPVLLAALAFAISGCATTVGLGQAALREGRYAEAASKFETALTEHPERTDALVGRSEEHTSELQSLAYLVCRLLLEKKKKKKKQTK